MKSGIALILGAAALFPMASSAADLNSQSCQAISKIQQQIDNMAAIQSLDAANQTIQAGVCATDWRTLRETLKDINAAKEAYAKNKTREMYDRQLAPKRAYDVATQNYKQCYGRALRTHSRYRNISGRDGGLGIRSYDGLQEKYALLSGDLGNYHGFHDFGARQRAQTRKKADTRIGELNGQCGAYMARTVSVFKDAQVRPRSAGKWIWIYEGRRLYLTDEIRTGKRGRLRLELADRVESGNRGPTVINVGSNSNIRMEKFKISFTDKPQRTGLISLIKGTVRAFTKNWGLRSAFSVRTGTSVVGIRGTDLWIAYDPNPNVDRVLYRLFSGTVRISTPGGAFDLPAGHTVSVKRGIPGEITRLRKGQVQ